MDCRENDKELGNLENPYDWLLCVDLVKLNYRLVTI
jgi:hypothetical protein